MPERQRPEPHPSRECPWQQSSAWPGTLDAVETDTTLGRDFLRKWRSLYTRSARGGGRRRCGWRSGFALRRLCSRSRLRLCSRCCVCAIRRFTLGQDQRDLLSDFGDASVGHINLFENAIIKCLHFHRRLVGFDFGEDVPGLYGVTLFLFPTRDGSFDHRVAQLGHGDDRHTILRGSDHDQQTSSTFETTLCGVGSWRGSTAGE